MDFISKLEQRFGSWAIPRLYVYIIALQAIGFVALSSGRADAGELILFGSSVIERGEWWRLLAFMMMPKTLSIFWFLISALVFYTIGGALEREWGTFRFNLFILVGYLLTVAMSFINPLVVLTNFYFLSCVFLAFAARFPNFEFLVFFVLPVKSKWFGWIMVVMFGLKLVQPTDSGNAPYVIGEKLAIVAAMLNFALFFGQDFIRGIKASQRKKAFVTDTTMAAGDARHTCKICGKTDATDPILDFRYCSTCGECFCEEHISNHEH